MSNSGVFFICFELNQLHVYTSCCFRFRLWDALDLFPMIYFMPKKSRQTLFKKNKIKRLLHNSKIKFKDVNKHGRLWHYVYCQVFNISLYYYWYIQFNLQIHSTCTCYILTMNTAYLITSTSILKPVSYSICKWLSIIL